MGTCQAQQLGNNQLLLVENGSRQTFVQTMSKEERKQHKLDQLAYLEERHQKLSENEYDYQNLLTNIRSNIMFDDNQFPPSSISIGDIQKQDDIQWKRIRQLIEHDLSIEQKFDTQSITRGTLNENNLRKIFFQQMLTYMSSYDGIIEQFLIMENNDQILAINQSLDLQQPQSPQLGNRKQNQSHVMSTGKRKLEQDQPKEPNNQFNLRKNGMYGVYLFNNKTRKQIVIDDYIPCNNQGTLFLQTQNNQFWPLIIEKAAAKIALSYTNLYNISISKMVSMFFNSIIITLQMKDEETKDEETIILNLENKIGAMFKNDNSFIFIYGPRSPGDAFYYKFDNKNYFQFNSYGQEVAKQEQLKQNSKEFKEFIGDKNIQKDSLFMNFEEIKARFKTRFQLNMNILYKLVLEKSYFFDDPIHIETCTFNIKQKTNIQIKYKLTNNISSFSFTVMRYKDAEDSLNSMQFTVIRMNDIEELQRIVTTTIEPGKQFVIIQTIMKNLKDKPDYTLKVKLAENIQKTQCLQYQEKLLYEFQKDHYTINHELQRGDITINCSLSCIGLISRVYFKYDQFDQKNENILELQFDLIGSELLKEDCCKIIYFNEQLLTKKAIRTATKMEIKTRFRIGQDMNCQARKEYNEFPNILSVRVRPTEITMNNIGLNLFINFKQINQNDIWYIYTILETTYQTDHKLTFTELILKNQNLDIIIKYEEKIIISNKQSYLFKTKINKKLEQSDLENLKSNFKNIQFGPNK